MFKCVIGGRIPYYIEEVSSETPEEGAKYFETKAEAESWGKQYLDEILGRQAAEIKSIEDLVRFAARHDMSGWSDCDDAWARRIYEIKCKEFGIEP